ncbi:MAG: Stealth CR1 domain-containing protein [Kiritimatiellae bacterium]|nr:Stealth CR1 domain-containing protein [Kiritimatiellia bacterium]
MEKIDFVVTWVDGGDSEWLAEKRKYLDAASSATSSLAGGEANADCRYRDCGLLKYWFRSVERFAPWVNRVFFVTCGQKPAWLDESNPKLRLVDHREYIPAECLPTFHSNTIELNLHRIPDLSERFVLFNDDMFLLKPVAPGFYFRKGLPVIPCDLGIPRWIGSSNISRIAINNSGVLKLGLDVERLVWRNILKFADVRTLGVARAVKNVLSFAVNRVYIAGTFGHLSQAHLKSTFAEVWRVQPRALERTSRSRFRTDDSVNHWLMSAWDMVSGRFFPVNEKRKGEFIVLTEDTVASACDAIRRREYPEICLNDKGTNADPERCFAEVARAFDAILPEKSSFER